MNNPNTDYFTDKAAHAVGVPAAVVLKHLWEHDGRFWHPASVKENYNRNHHDRTTWYALTDTGRGLMG